MERLAMLTYKAMYKYLDEAVHAEVMDFPGVITFGANLEEARRMLAMLWWTWLRQIYCGANRFLLQIRLSPTRRPIWKSRSTCC